MSLRARLLSFFQKSIGAGEVTPDEVDFVYRLLLGRSPESPEIAAHWRRTGLPLETLAANMLASDEFAMRWSRRAAGQDDTAPPPSAELALLHRHARVVTGHPDHVTNFLGVRTRLAFLPGLANSGAWSRDFPSLGTSTAISWSGWGACGRWTRLEVASSP